MVEPFWMMMSLKRGELQGDITILGFGNQEKESLATAQERAEPGCVVAIFDMSQDAKTIGTNVSHWLVENGVEPEEAAACVREVGKVVSMMLLRGDKPNGHPEDRPS